MPSYTIEETLNKWLLATAGITALVSTRIHSNRPADTAAMPYLYFRLESEEYLEETFATPAGMIRAAVVSFTCVADRAAAGTKAARDIAEAVAELLRNYTGTPVVNGKTIDAVTGLSIGSGLAEDSAYDEQRVTMEARATICYR